jgi:pimeloyl-ACP methyl ester carboxylesterase
VAQLPFRTFLALFEDVIEFDGTENARAIQAPTLIISGEKDSVTPTVQQNRLRQLIDSSELSIVPYGSHCCQLDFPDYVNLKTETHIRNAVKQVR